MSIAQTLEEYLTDRGARFTIEHHAASTSSLGTARSACIDEDCLAKSVVLEDERGFVLAVLPASRRLELGQVRRKLRRALRISQEDDMVGLFPDCAFGAIPPLGSAYGLPTVVDASLEGRDEVFFEGGDHETLIRMEGGDFLGLLATASVAEIASESASLTAALALRERFFEVQLAVRRAVGAPIKSGGRWRVRLKQELARLSMATDDHIVETEAPDGVLSEIIGQAPRLWREVEKLKAEHTEMLEGCSDILESLNGSDSARLIRREAQALLAKYEAHRHRGADLVFEAFEVDIGGG